jgi:hypothetical protein
MADENRIVERLEDPPGHAWAFHRGSAPQSLPFTAGAEATEEEEAALALHRARIRVPESKPRFGRDEDGNPIEVPPSGLVYNPDTGGLEIPDTDDEGGPRRARRSGSGEREREPTAAPPAAERERIHREGTATTSTRRASEGSP